MIPAELTLPASTPGTSAAIQWFFRRFAVLGFLFATLSALGAPADVDTSFGTGGAVLTPSGATRGMAVQADGKIVLTTRPSSDSLGVERRNSDGSIDGTFNNGTGRASVVFDGSSVSANAIAVQLDGKIVVAGTAVTGTDRSFAAARFLSTGEADVNFNGAGKVMTLMGGTQSGVTAVRAQADGKVVLAGVLVTGTTREVAIVRYRADGSLDPEFNGGGILTQTFQDGHDYVEGLHVYADGKILIAGGINTPANKRNFALMRIGSNGALDSSFGTGGRVITAIGSGSNLAQALAVAPGGEIYAAGYCIVAAQDIAVARYTAAGVLDPRFGGTGKVITSTSSSQDGARAVAIQADGKLIVAGYAYNGSDYDFVILRYTDEGDLDGSFAGWQGFSYMDMGSGTSDVAEDVAVGPDGRIFVSGSEGSARALVGLLGTRPTYTVTASDGSGGAISPIGAQAVSWGDSITFTAQPDPGYLPYRWSVDGIVRQTGGNAFTLQNVTKNTTVYLSFAVDATIETLDVTNVTETTATLNGSFNANGKSIAPSFAWGETVAGIVQVPPLVGDAVSGSTTQTRSLDIGGLESGKTYYYRAIAWGGIAAGPIRSFTTQAPRAPTLVLGAATNLTPDGGARLNATVHPGLLDTVVTFYINGFKVGTAAVPAGAAEVPVHLDVNGLEPATAFTFIATAENVRGVTQDLSGSFVSGGTPIPEVDYFFSDRGANFRFVVFDRSSGDAIMVTAAKLPGRKIGRVKRIDYCFAEDSNEYPMAQLTFVPDRRGLPVKITSSSGLVRGRESVTFAWKRNLSSVTVASSWSAAGRGGGRLGAGTRSYPNGIEQLVDSSCFNGVSVDDAAESGKLGRWLCETWHNVGTWAYIASETLLAGPTAEGAAQGIVMDPRRSGSPVMMAFCSSIGGYRSGSSLAAAAVSERAVSLRKILPRFPDKVRVSSRDGDTNDLPGWTWALLMPRVRSWLATHGVGVMAIWNDDDLDRGWFTIRWAHTIQRSTDAKEGTTLTFEIERQGGTDGTQKAYIDALGTGLVPNALGPAATPGKDFVVPVKEFTFEEGETKKTGTIQIKADREPELIPEGLILWVRPNGMARDENITATIGNVALRSYLAYLPRRPVKTLNYDGTEVDDWVSGSIELSKDPDGYAVTILWSIEGQRIAEKVEIVRAGDLPDQIVLDHEFSNSDWGS